MRALGESPLPQRDAAVFEELAPLRLRPGRKFDARAFSATEREAISAASPWPKRRYARGPIA